jgi:REP element-mobilizing transposase RayT
MGYIPRDDAVGTWHHVMNRGIARRTVFECSDDIRFFLSRIAHTVRRKEIEVHVYSIMATHFHLLVRSLRGELSHAMMWIQGQYVRWFNRRRLRDGPLFRGRFRSCRVSSDIYWRILVRYIDQNAVDAGVVHRPENYPYCSAYYHARRIATPWLTGEAIAKEIRGVLGAQQSDPDSYSLVFGDGMDHSIKWLVDQRLSNPLIEEDQLDHLVNSAPTAIRKWMTRKALLADGTSAGQTLVDPSVILERIAKHRETNPGWQVKPARKEKSGWIVLTAGLFRMISGISVEEVSRRLSCGESSTSRYIHDHAILLQTDEEYAQYAARIAHESLRHCFGKKSNSAIKVQKD